MLSPAALEHRERRRALLAAQPQLRALIGSNPWSLAFIALLIGMQTGMAWLVRDGGLLTVFLASFCVGQIILHAGGALVHDAAHGSILRRKRLLVDIALDVLLTSFGHHAQYQLDHVYSHHPYLGDYERDYEHKDACRFRARKALSKARPLTHRGLIALQLFLDLLPFGFVYSDDIVAAIERRSTTLGVEDVERHVFRPALARKKRWLLRGVSVLVLVVVGLTLGPWALLYWVWSLSIFQGRMGITNVGQVLAEHPEGPHVTYSRYGFWNLLLFNTGYHDEHHTFPGVPWNRLPELKRRAPHAFVAASERGYFRWWFEYVFRMASRRREQHIDERRCEPKVKNRA